MQRLTLGIVWQSRIMLCPIWIQLSFPAHRLGQAISLAWSVFPFTFFGVY